MLRASSVLPQRTRAGQHRLRPPVPMSPAAMGLSPGVGQYVGGRPVIDRMAVGEIVSLEVMTRLAAIGCAHEGNRELSAEFHRDAEWLREVLRERQRRMRGAHG